MLRKTLAVALTALTLGAAALTTTEASARGFGHHGGFSHHGGFRHFGGFSHRHFGGFHHRHWYRPYYRSYSYYTPSYGSCWRWVFVPGVGTVRKYVCTGYSYRSYYTGGYYWKGHRHWGGHRFPHIRAFHGGFRGFHGGHGRHR